MSIKFAAYYLTHSNAILSDALESIINVIASAFAFYSIYLSSQPKDHDPVSYTHLDVYKRQEYEYGGDAWKAQLAKSKFTKWAYATPHAKGKIALQDHGDEVWYKNMRIRKL